MFADMQADVSAALDRTMRASQRVRSGKWAVSGASNELDKLLTLVAQPSGGSEWGRIRHVDDSRVDSASSDLAVELEALADHVASCETCVAADPVRFWHCLTHVLLWGGNAALASEVIAGRILQLSRTPSRRVSVLVAELDALAVARFEPDQPALPYSYDNVVDRVLQIAADDVAESLHEHIVDDIAWFLTLTLDEAADIGGTAAWYKTELHRFDDTPLRNHAHHVHQRIAQLHSRAAGSSGHVRA